MSGTPHKMELTPPSEEQLKRIFEDIHLTEAQHKKDTRDLHDWLQSQPHLPHDIDEALLASFLVGSKNSMERCKQVLDAYLTNRTTCPEFYSSRDPCDPEAQRLAKTFQYMMLPGMTSEGYRVSIFRIQNHAADLNLRINAIKVLSSYDVRFLEDTYWAGDVTIINCRHFGFKHLQGITLPLLKKYVHCASDSVPVRQKKIIFINMSSIIHPIINMVKMVLKKKIAKRIITTPEDYPFLYNHVPRDMLPDEYGGEAGTLEHLNDSWQLKVESYRDWFLQDMKRTVDETKRPEKSAYKPKQQFGIEGSFRTLAID